MEDSGLSPVDGHVLLWLDGRNIDRKSNATLVDANPLIPGTTWPMNKMKWWHRADRVALPSSAEGLVFKPKRHDKRGIREH